MRTLFLMAILIVLIVMASKEPDQTAWEAARELSSRAKETLSEVQDDPIVAERARNAAEEYARWEERIHKALEIEEPFDPFASGQPDNTRSVDVAREPVPPAREESGTESTRKEVPPAPLPEPEKTTPPPVPDLPRLPAKPVQIGKVENPPFRAIEVPEPRSTARESYGEVRTYYENANRLLREIK